MVRVFRFSLLLLIAVMLTSCSKKQGPEGSGLQFTDTVTLNKVINAKPPFLGSSHVPPSVDLSTKMPPPGNQGAQNSCVGWSIAYGMKSYQEKEARNWELTDGESIKKEHVFSPAYIYNQINHGEDKGSRFTDAFNVVQTKGVASLEKDPYDDKDFTTKPNDDANTEASYYKIAWAKKIDPKDIDGLKSYLAKGYPIIIAISFDHAFMDFNGPAVVTTMEPGAAMGHAMLVVGYDEDKKCFRIMNSWGTGWRDGGFCWFTYDLFKQVTRESWIAKDEEDKREIKKEDEPQVNDNTPIVDEVISDLMIKDVEYDSENPADKDAGKCLKISGTVKLDKNFGDAARIIVFLDYDNGSPVTAVNDKYAYYDGGVSGFTESIDIRSFDEQVKDFTVYIPYSAFKPDKEKADKIIATPFLFVDDFDATDGKPVAVKLSGE
jgi:C1A family cysteine protease